MASARPQKKTNRVAHELDRPGENLATLGTHRSMRPRRHKIGAAQAIRDSQLNPAFSWREGTPIKANLPAANVGLSYDLTDDILLYSSFGKGVEVGLHLLFATDAVATESQAGPSPSKL